MYAILQECPLFRGLSSLQIEALLAKASYVVNRYAEGELIARRDTVYSGLMIILSGSARGEITQANGRRRIIDNIPAPQLIAPAFLFGGYNRLPIDVVANEDVTLLTLHRGGLFEMMQDNTLVLSNFIDIISNRANFFSRKIYALSVLMLTEKLAALLLAEAGERNEAQIDISKLADRLDVTRNALEQTLDELQKRGWIALRGGHVTFRNRPALAMAAGQ